MHATFRPLLSCWLRPAMEAADPLLHLDPASQAKDSRSPVPPALSGNGGTPVTFRLLNCPRLDRSGYHRRGTGTGPGHTIGRWLAAFDRPGGPGSLDPRPSSLSGGAPRPRSCAAGGSERGGEELPASSGIGLANWNWKVVCQYVSERFGISLSRSTCLNYRVRRLDSPTLQTPQETAAQGQIWRNGRSSSRRSTPPWHSQAQKAGEKVFFADEPRLHKFPHVSALFTLTPSCGASGS